MLTRSFHRVFFFLGVLTLLSLTRESQATTYYVDYASGNDAKTGKTTAEAWKHCPGGADAAGTAASTVLKAGDYVVFKRGVTYAGALITVGASGAQVAAAKDATINSSGILTSPSGQFQTKGVAPSTDYVLIYHCKTSVTNTWVESCGLFTLNSVNSQTELALKDFTGKAYSTPEMAYVVVRPITFKSVADWGSGDAIFTGDKDGDGDPQGANDTATIFDVSARKYLRFQDLKFYKTKDTLVREDGAIKAPAGDADYLQVVGCQFDQIGSSAVFTGSTYGYTAHNTVQNIHGWGLVTYGLSSIQEYNTVIGDNVNTPRSGMGGTRFSIIRFNLIKDIVGAWGGAHADSIGFVDGGPNGDNDFSWVYGNTLDNFVEAMALYGTGGGTSNWVIHSNVVISRRSETGKGDCMMLITGTDTLYILNNTFVGVQGSGLGATGSSVIRVELHSGVSDSKNIIIKNNLVLADSGGSINIMSGQATGLVVENNHYYFKSNNSPFWYSDVSKTLDGWKTVGLDNTPTGFHATRGITVDPQVISVANQNFSLLPTSPDLYAGLDLSEYFTIDKAGNTRVPGAGKWSIGAFCAAPDHIRPSQPLNLASQALSSEQIHLTWTQSTDNIAVMGYWILRDNTTVTQTASTSFDDSDLHPSTAYTYKVIAYDGAGNKSLPSAPASVTTQAPPPLKIFAQNASVIEGVAGTKTNAVFLLTLSTPSADTVTVDYATRDGSATVADNDYQATQGKAVFPPGKKVFAVPVLVTGDSKSESDETFYLDLSNPVGAPLDASSVVGTIKSDDAEVTNGLQGCWKLDEASGTVAADSSGKGIAGNLKNGPVWKTGRINGALGFDGVDDYVDLGTGDFGITSEFTVSLWVRISALPSTVKVIFVRGNSYPFRISLNTDGNLYGAVRTSNGITYADTGIPLVPDVWSHFAMTFKNGERNIYLNGQKVITDTLTGTLSTNSASTWLGKSDTAGQYYNGDADDVRIYNRALTSDEILVLNGSGPLPADTAAPSIPQNLAATADSSGWTSLTWAPSTDNTAVVGYKVFRDGTLLGTTSVASYVDSTINRSTQYVYTISAFDQTGNESAQSAPLSFKSGSDVSVPNKPENLKAHAVY